MSATWLARPLSATTGDELLELKPLAVLAYRVVNGNVDQLLCADEIGEMRWRPMSGVRLCDPSVADALDRADRTIINHLKKLADQAAAA